MAQVFLIKILFFKRLKRSNLPHKIIAQVRVGEKNMRSQQYVVKQIVIVYVVYDQKLFWKEKSSRTTNAPEGRL